MENVKIELPHFTLKRVSFQDEESITYIQKLAEDPEVKKFLPYFKNGIYISKNIGYLNSHYIALQKNQKIGYVYFSSPFLEDNSLNSEIRYIIDPNSRGKGLEKALISESSEQILSLDHIHNLRAFIHPKNTRSIAIILNAKFQQTDRDLDGIGFTKPNHFSK